MISKPNVNVVVICATVILMLVIAAIAGLEFAGRSVPNFLSSLFGFLASAIPATMAYLKSSTVKKLVNGHLIAHQQQTTALASELTRVDPTNSVLQQMTGDAIDGEKLSGSS